MEDMVRGDGQWWGGDICGKASLVFWLGAQILHELVGSRGRK